MSAIIEKEPIECRFCNKILNKGSKKIEDTILYENDHFVCIPALGCFITGYTLLISKKHVTSIGDFSDKENLSLKDIVQSVSSRGLYRKGYLLFEHGNSSNIGKASCIGHFHFHLVPWVESNFNELFLEQDCPAPNCEEFDEGGVYREFITDKEYIMLSNGVKTCFFFADSFKSQYIRKVLSRKLNQKEKWNWAIFPFDEKIVETIKLF